MELTLWTYEGPPHVGAMRIATSMNGLHYVLHAPQGDTYADLLFTMIERRSTRPPVTYTTFEARDLGGDTAELFKTAVRDAYERCAPQAMLVGASCTAELLQDDPGGLARALRLPIPVIPLELPAYQKKENWGASETFYRLVRSLVAASRARVPDARPRCNILGPTALGFRHRDDVREISGILKWLGVEICVTAPLGATPEDITRLGEADFNVVLYPEIALPAAQWLEKNHKQPFTQTIPIGVGATRDFHRRSGRTRRRRSCRGLDDRLVTLALVFALGRIRPISPTSGSSSSATPRTRSPRRASREPSSASRSSASEPTRGSSPAKSAKRGRSLRSRSADRRRLSRSRSEGRRTAAGTRSRHPDGASHRQAARNSLRRDLRADARSGLPGPIILRRWASKARTCCSTPGFIR